MRRFFSLTLHLLALLFLIACDAGREPAQELNSTLAENTPRSSSMQTASASQTEEVPVYGYEIVNSWPHLRSHFTQGLVYHDGKLYESTGQYGSSLLCRLDLKSGEVKKKVDVDRQYFAEGMTILNDRIFQLTWQAHKGFIYDLKDFKPLGEFAYDGEGWGLTNDGQSLIMSDGTNRLRFLDPQSFSVARTVEVFDHGHPLLDLNELEYIKGEIYANIWHSDRIVRIDPKTGKITAWIDLSGLRPREDDDGDSDNVLNGIAYDSKADRLFVTGKRWSKLFEIRLVKKGMQN
jgi:glutamine cyclotransferase